MNLQEMIARQQQITDLARAEGRDLTAEERSEFDNLQRQIDEAQPGSTGARSTPEPSGAGQGDDDVGLERQRCADIIALCRDFDVDPTNYIRNNTDIGTVRAEILNQMRSQHPPVSTGVRVTRDEADKFRAAASDALLMRSSISVQEPEDGATELRAMSIRELALECLRMDGQESSMRMNNDQLFDQLARQFFNPTASFPAILDQTIRKAYVHGYDTVGATFDRWVSTGSLPNFLESKAGYMAGSAGEFLLVPESGELKADLPKDHLQPTRKLDTYGRQFSMSRQAFINDDIGYLTTIPARYAASARTTINNQVYGILTGNPVIYDGVELFHAAHGNLVETGTDLTAEAIQRAIIKMRLARDPDGKRINITPRYLIVPVGYEFKAYAILAATTVIKSEVSEYTNPLAGMGIEVITDVALNDAVADGSAVPWFLVADKNSVSGVQVDYLNGQSMPTIRRSEKAGQLGFIYDIFMDWGISVIDYRGIIKNPGVPLIL